MAKQPTKTDTLKDIHFQKEIVSCDLIKPIFEQFSNGSYTKQKTKSSRGLIMLVSNFLEKEIELRHQLIDGAYAMSKGWLYRHFGRKEYEKLIAGESLLNKLLTFHTTGEPDFNTDSPMAGQATAWVMTEAFERTLDDLKFLMMFLGNNNAFTDKTHIGQNCSIKLIEPEKMTIEDGWINCPVKLPQRYVSSRVDYFIGRNNQYIHDGWIDQWYKPCRTETNRLYGVGTLTLQNKPKRFRNEFFTGKWSVDASCCAQTILNQVYETQTGLKLETLSMMVNDKRAFRKRLSMEIFGSDKPEFIGLIKGAIMPLAFGGRIYPFKVRKEGFIELSEEDKKEKNKFAKEIMSHYKCSPNTANDIIYRIIGNDLYSALVDDIKKIFDALKFDYPAHRETREQQVSYFYQHEESRIMAVVKEMAGETLELLIHDGIIVNKKMNLKEISKKVLENTGYKMIFEQDRL